MLKNILKYSSAFLADFLFSAYIVLLSQKLVFEKIILGSYELSFEWSELTMVAIVSVIMALLFMFVPGLSLGKRIQKLHPKSEKNSFKPSVILIVLLLILTFIAGIHFTQISFFDFFSESGRIGAQRIFTALVSPNTSIFESALFAAIETIYMAFMATIIAIPFAFLISFVAAKNLMNKHAGLLAIYNLVRLFLNFTRSIEPIVWAIIFTVWVGIGPFAGMLALVLHSIAALSKLYSEQIETISDGPVEAIRATGASGAHVLWYGVVPQIILPYLSFTIYRWDINVRMATVIGLVGGGGIGTMLMQYTGLAKWNEVGLIVFVIAAIVWLMDWSSAKIRESIK